MGKRVRIGTKQDFPSLKVYKQTGKNGLPIFTISFNNKEPWQGFGFGLITITLIIGFLASFLIHWALTLAILAISVRFAFFQRNVHRTIIADFSKGELRVTGPVNNVRKPIVLRNLTIEPHPEAEIEYRKMNGALGPKQKQHCLVGWFGMAGADRKELIYRHEWPNKNSLLEVQQALHWVMEQGNEELAKATLPAGGSDSGPGIAPPLD